MQPHPVPTPGRVPPLDAATLLLPTQVAYFSIQPPARALRTLDATALTPVAAFPLPANLDAGYPDPVATGGGAPWCAARVDEVVASLIAAGVDVSSLDVVSYRNNLLKIGGTVIDTRQGGWQVDAIALKSAGDAARPPTVFLDIVRPVEQGEPYPDADRYVYWGYNLESLAAAAGSGAAPAPARVDRAEFVTVVTRHVGGLTCAIAGETDGFDKTQVAATAPPPPPGALWATHNNTTVPPSSYIELKTVRWPAPHARGAQATLFNVKTAKWWLQAFLCGIQTIVLGGRDAAGLLTRVDAVPAADLPGWSASKGASWTPDKTIAVLHDVLRFFVDTARQHEGKSLRFEYVPCRERGLLGQVTVRAVESDVGALVRAAGF